MRIDGGNDALHRRNGSERSYHPDRSQQSCPSGGHPAGLVTRGRRATTRPLFVQSIGEQWDFVGLAKRQHNPGGFL